MMQKEKKYLSENDSDLKLFKAFFKNKELFKSEINQQILLELNKYLPDFAENLKVIHIPSILQ